MNRFVASLALLAGAALHVSGAAWARQGALQKVGKDDGWVAIVASPGCIARGAIDLNFDWAAEFEAKPNCKVKVVLAQRPGRRTGSDRAAPEPQHRDRGDSWAPPGRTGQGRASQSPVARICLLARLNADPTVSSGRGRLPSP